MPQSPTATRVPSSWFSRNRVKWVRWFSVALILAALALLLKTLPTESLLEAVQEWIDRLGFWGPVALGTIYVLATLLFIPGSVLTLAAGAIFGLFQGMVIVSLASTTAAALAFLIARYFARDKVRTRIEQSPKLTAVDGAIGEQGWKIVALLRLSPAVPFNLQNYLYGVTAIRFWPCVLASWIAMLPGTFMYVYLGSLGGSAATARDTTVGEWALRVIGLIATIAVSVYIARLARNAIQQRTEIESNNESPDSANTGTKPATESDTKDVLNWKHVGMLAFALILFASSLWAFLRQEVVRQYILSYI